MLANHSYEKTLWYSETFDISRGMQVAFNMCTGRDDFRVNFFSKTDKLNEGTIFELSYNGVLERGYI